MLIIDYIKRLYIAFNRIRKQFRWFIQFNSIKKITSKSTASVYKKGRFQRILIVIPHADDELIGCYQLIKSNREAVKLFYCGFLGGNLSLDNRTARLGEFEGFCNSMSVKYTVSSDEVEADLQKEIIEYSPDAIFLPSCIDWHDEHRSVNYISAKVLEHTEIIPMIVWYQISVPISNDSVSWFVELSEEEQNDKWNEFERYYKTQRHMPIKRFKYEERISGWRYGLFASEVFCAMTIEQWKSHLDKLKSPEFTIKIKSFSSSINNLRKIYKEVDSVYKFLKYTIGI